MPSYLSLLEAARRSQSKLFQGIALGLVSRDELAALMPFKVFDGQTMVYVREGLRPTTGFINDAGDNMQAPSTGTSDVVTVPVRRVGSDVDVDGLANDLSGGSEMGAQVALKARVTWDLVRQKVVRGKFGTAHTLASPGAPFTAITGMQYGPWLDSVRFGDGEIQYTHAGTSWKFRAPGDQHFGDPVTAAVDGVYLLKSHNSSKWILVTLDVSNAAANGRTAVTFSSVSAEFDGMNQIIDPAFVRDPVAADGDLFTLSILDELMRMERVRTNRVFIMSSLMKLQYLSVQRSLGGTTPAHMQIPGYGGPTDVYRGVPIIECDEIVDTETVGTSSDCSSIYLASLDPDDGLFMGVPGAAGNTTLNIEGDPRTRPVMGFRIKQIGDLEDKPHERTRVLWYGALGLRNTKALVRARGVRTSAP
jgi:hypothetical protein